MTTTMIEVVIERSANAEGETTYRWTVWNGDQQVESGRTDHFSPTECEASATEFCRRALGFRPDKVTQR